MRPSPSHRLRHRAGVLLRHPAFAAVAALVWLLGVEVGPGLHIALHAQLGHHHHGAGEALGCASHEEQGHEHREQLAAAGAHEHRVEAGAHEHHAAPTHHEHHAAPTHHEHHAAPTHHEHHAAPEHHEHHAAPTHHEHHAAPTHHEHHAAPTHHEHHAAPKHHEHHAEPEDGPAADALGGERFADAHASGSAVPHGTGSLAHRDLVPLTPLPALPPILSAPWRPLEVVAVLRVAPRDRTPDVLRARGPPRGRSTPEPSSVV